MPDLPECSQCPTEYSGNWEITLNLKHHWVDILGLLHSHTHPHSQLSSYRLTEMKNLSQLYRPLVVAN